MQPKGRKRKARSAGVARKAKLPRQLAPKEQRERLKPISLHPLKFEEAIKRLLAVPMERTRGKPSA